jgi:hypothetical protein
MTARWHLVMYAIIFLWWNNPRTQHNNYLLPRTGEHPQPARAGCDRDSRRQKMIVNALIVWRALPSFGLTFFGC